jgi:hypothetical protein
VRDGTGHVAGVGKRKTHTGFWWVHLKKRDHLVSQVQVEGSERVGSIHLLPKRDKWRALVNTVARLLDLRKD